MLDQVKHYAAYNQETNRNTKLDNVLVADRTLHEIYLPAFQAAIQRARAASVMCACSVINGNFACQNPYREKTVLRDQWDFPGFVTSDYAAIHDTVAAVDGTDMEQPFNSNFCTPLLTAVRNGTIARSVVQITCDSDVLTWATPSGLAPGIAQAVAAAKSASTAVVVVSDDTETEAADRPSLDLPSAQNELISAVAAASPHTVVVINAGAPVAMPWLTRAAAVVDAWYPGQTSGTALASVLFGNTDPGGHLPVTFPRNLAQVPAAPRARFPGINGKVHYSEGLDVGYRW